MYFSVSVGLCTQCGQVSNRAKSYTLSLLRHKNGEFWGCPHCGSKSYFLMPAPKYTPARDYLYALAEALATWPNGKFRKAKELVEQSGGW